MGASIGAGPNTTKVSAARAKELLAELKDAVLLARVAPGQRLSRAAFAGFGRASERDLEAVLPAILATGLVTLDGDAVVARPLDANAMFATLPRRMEIELAIVRAAAQQASDQSLKAMRASEAQQQRCALIGDMDGMMQAERELESLLVEASGLHGEGAELKAIKQEFRRAWCAANRLRDFTNVANIRTALVAAIAARDVAASEQQVRVFFEHLIRTY
jgi:DNA-binding GntR family transcriptional regulator